MTLQRQGTLKPRACAAESQGVAYAAAARPARISVRRAIACSAPDAVLEWRFDELERAGYDSLSALRLALAVAVDLTQARALTRRGCPPVLAARILL